MNNSLDNNIINSDEYKEFIKNNPSLGYLKIRAYAANQAIPISGIKIKVSKLIGNNDVIFFEGVTNQSGVVDKITLPAPIIDKSDLIQPSSTEYNISAISDSYNIKQIYTVNIYENLIVVQNISVVPDMNMGGI